MRVRSSNGLEDTAKSKVTLPIKGGVVIFGYFAPDRDFCTYHKLFVGVKLV